MDDFDLDFIITIIVIIITIIVLLIIMVIFFVIRFLFSFGLFLLVGDPAVSLSCVVLLGLCDKLAEIAEPLFGHSVWEDADTVTMKPLVTAITIEHEAVVPPTLAHASRVLIIVIWFASESLVILDGLRVLLIVVVL